MSTPERRPRQQTVLTVIATEWIAPHLVRVIAGGDDLAGFPADAQTDAYVKIVFVRPDLGLTPPYDVDALRAELPQEDWPVVRTYTVRWVDREARRIAIEFVVHGDEGVAGPWAASATAGDLLVYSGPGGGYTPRHESDWHLFAGDASALPAIAAALEALPPTAVGVAHLEVLSADDILDLTAPEGVVLRWHVNATPDAASASLLADAIEADVWPVGVVQVFAHGERESMKAVRAVLKARGVDRSQISLSGYWARGRTEDTFQAEKRLPVGQIES